MASCRTARSRDSRLSAPPTDLPGMVAYLARKVAEIERRLRGQSQEGRVVEADPGRGRYRVALREGDEEFISPWLRTEALSAGALRIQAEPTIGQTVQVRSESGDLTDGIIALSGYHEDDELIRPHDKNGEFYLTVGASTIHVNAEMILLQVGGSFIKITADRILEVSPRIDMNP